MNPTETLRAAATLLREMAQAATPGPWVAYPTITRAIDPETREDSGVAWTIDAVQDEHGYGPSVLTTGAEGCEEDFVTRADALLIATLGPTFAVLVADWLDDAATGEDWLDAQLAPGLMPYVPRLPDWTPLALARHLLGEVS